MSLFSSILEELTKKLSTGEQYKKEIAETVSSIVGFTFLPDHMIIKNGVLFINASPTVKTAILLRKQKILENVRKYNIKTIG